MTNPPIRPDPARIIVPRKHAQILIEPPLSVLRSAITLPSARDGYDQLTFANQPLAPLRTAARQHLLAAAQQWARQTSAPLPPENALEKPFILTGHQVEFYHAGVWAKVIAADQLAKRTDALAFDILVDHDTIDHLGFDVPAQDGPHWKRTPVHWAPAPDLPADSIPAPAPDQFEHWDAALAQHPQSHTDSLAFLLAALKPKNSEFRIQNPELIPYVPWMSAARAKFEHAMDLRVHHVPTSLLCQSHTWEIFISAWIDNADAWTASYNTHLAAYRARQGIKNPQHPMPNLARTIASDTITYELPFWIYKNGHPRQRLLIKKSPTQTTILHDNTELPFDSAFRIPHSAFNIRPRALTLTMYLRLFLADLFIHGIGGALYDQITDGILEDLFHAAPPYACVSAAWLLPLGQPLENTDDIPHLLSHRHHLLHNPQLALDPFTALKTHVAELILARKNLIAQIANSLAADRRQKPAIAKRRQWFRELHAINLELHLQSPNILNRLDHQIQDAKRSREQNKVLLHREYYYALHTMPSLHQLIQKIATPT